MRIGGDGPGEGVEQDRVATVLGPDAALGADETGVGDRGLVVAEEPLAGGRGTVEPGDDVHVDGGELTP